MNRLMRFVLLLCCVGFVPRPARGDVAPPANQIACGDFQGKVVHGLPEGWRLQTPRPSLAPKFQAANENGRPCLHVSGNGNANCVGWVSARARIERGKTYWLRARFRRSDSLDPLQHLLFMIVADGTLQGIGEFHRLEGNEVEAEGRVCFPGKGPADAEARILYRLSPDGEAWIEHISLTETTPLPPRWVRVACTQGPGRLEEYGLKAFGQALDAAGQEKVDLFLLPEYFNGEGTTETLSGPSVRLMSEKAARYHMYVAGTIGLYDPATDRLTNSALLFDRSGKQIGSYEKVHLYAPELHDEGILPGDRVPVFTTDFGRVGFMTCYDSWFTDVAELAALRGADLLLFPNLGYDRGLMHARSLDNRINIVTSTRSGGYGVWDTQGRDVVSASSESGEGSSFKDVAQLKVADMGLLLVTLNLNAAPDREWNGGTKSPVLRGSRQRSNSRVWLDEELLREKLRWWTEP